METIRAVISSVVDSIDELQRFYLRINPSLVRVLLQILKERRVPYRIVVEHDVFTLDFDSNVLHLVWFINNSNVEYRKIKPLLRRAVYLTMDDAPKDLTTISITERVGHQTRFVAGKTVTDRLEEVLRLYPKSPIVVYGNVRVETRNRTVHRLFRHRLEGPVRDDDIFMIAEGHETRLPLFTRPIVVVDSLYHNEGTVIDRVSGNERLFRSKFREGLLGFYGGVYVPLTSVDIYESLRAPPRWTFGTPFQLSWLFGTIEGYERLADDIERHNLRRRLHEDLVGFPLRWRSLMVYQAYLESRPRYRVDFAAIVLLSFMESSLPILTREPVDEFIVGSPDGTDTELVLNIWNQLIKALGGFRLTLNARTTEAIRSWGRNVGVNDELLVRVMRSVIRIVSMVEIEVVQFDVPRFLVEFEPALQSMFREARRSTDLFFRMGNRDRQFSRWRANSLSHRNVVVPLTWDDQYIQMATEFNHPYEVTTPPTLVDGIPRITVGTIERSLPDEFPVEDEYHWVESPFEFRW